MSDFDYPNKEGDYLSAEPLIPSESYEMNMTRPRRFWRIVSWVLHLTGLVVICILSTKLAMKVNIGMDLACLQLQSAWCKLELFLVGLPFNASQRLFSKLHSQFTKSDSMALSIIRLRSVARQGPRLIWHGNQLYIDKMVNDHYFH